MFKRILTLEETRTWIVKILESFLEHVWGIGDPRIADCIEVANSHCWKRETLKIIHKKNSCHKREVARFSDARQSF